ncbi:hypothetical protein ACH4E8_24940 [Streptomyces sp. NPDC017979]
MTPAVRPIDREPFRRHRARPDATGLPSSARAAAGHGSLPDHPHTKENA